MPSIDELLQKNKDKLEKLNGPPTPRKKIVRTGPTRPWQENLPQYSTNTTEELRELGSFDAPGTSQRAKIDKSENDIAVQLRYSSGTKNQKLASEKLPLNTPRDLQAFDLDSSQNDLIEEGKNCGTITVQTELNSLESKENTVLDKSKLSASKSFENNSINTQLQNGLPAAESDFIAVQLPYNSGTNTSASMCEEEVAVQLRYKNGTNGVQKQVNSSTIAVQLPYYSGTKSVQESVHCGTDYGTNCGTTFSDKSPSNRSSPDPKHIVFLSEQQRKILDFIFEKSLFSSGEKSQCISSRETEEKLKISKNSKEIAIKRLLKSGHIFLVGVKRGPSGWAQYSIAKKTYQELWQEKASPIKDSKSNFSDCGTNCGTDYGTIAVPSSSSSSYININKTTTTEPQTENDLDPDWLAIDYSDLTEIGFGKGHLKQWQQRQYCSAREAQESIYHFAFHLKTSLKKPEKPLNYLMGVMSRDKYFSQPNGFKSPADLALEKRIESEKKNKEERMRKREELFELLAEKWLDSLSGSQIKAYAACYAPGLKSFEAQRSILLNKFREEYYLTILDQPDLDVTKLLLDDPKESPQGSESTPISSPASGLSYQKLQEKAESLRFQIESLAKNNPQPKSHAYQVLLQLEDTLASVEKELNLEQTNIRNILDQRLGKLPDGDQAGEETS